MIILLIVLIVSFIMYFLLCCGYCERDGNQKPWVVLSIICYLLFFACFVVIVVYVGIVAASVDETLCETYKIPSGMIDGYDEGS